jgi:hypothetical protein
MMTLIGTLGLHQQQQKNLKKQKKVFFKCKMKNTSKIIAIFHGCADVT